MWKLIKANKKYIINYFIVMMVLYSFTILPDINDENFSYRTIAFIISTPILLIIMFYMKKEIIK